jgi:signal transduction histidine kinase
VIVAILSDDIGLCAVCRDLLAAEGVADGEIACCREHAAGDADLYIRDVPPHSQALEGLRPAELSRSIVLLPREAAGSLADAVLSNVIGVVLKPGNHLLLRAVIGRAVAVARQRQAEAASGGLKKPDQARMLQSLMSANLRLQEYDQDRSNFLARVAHDFRAPLTSIGGYCGLLLSGQLGALDGRQREVLQRMGQSAERLSRLASAVVDVAAGRNLRPALQLEEADIQGCVRQVLHEIAPIAASKQLQVSVALEPPATKLRFHRYKIEQVFQNLLENSCKFSPKRGCIKISGGPSFYERRFRAREPFPAKQDRRRTDCSVSNCYRLAVEDNGPGIVSEHIDTIFEEYRSYAGGLDRSGAGLGLAICKTIVEQHGGRIWAESNGPGARISFVLPYPACAAAHAAASMEAQGD